jgi:AraC-like DNA-binding protein
MHVRAAALKQFSAVPSASGGITRLAYARARHARVGLPALLSKAGLTDEQIADPSARVNVGSQIRFLGLVADALNDDFLGFHLARDFDLREVGLLYYVLASSDVIGDSLRRAERYSGIVNEGVFMRLGVGSETAVTFSYVGVERHSDRHQIEFWLTSLVRICRQLTNRRLFPSRVKVVHSRTGVERELCSFLGCDVEFGADRDEVAFPEAVKSMPVVSADPYLNKILLRYCEDALAHRVARRGSLRPDLENAIAPLLPHGKARAGDVARKLGMSERTLARRLSAEGLTFTGVLDELKHGLADSYLKEPGLPISQMAWLLGYREVSAFTHAYKRWTGKTPRQMRSRADFPPHKARTTKATANIARRR